MMRSVRWAFCRVISVALLLAISTPAFCTNTSSSPLQDESSLKSWVIFSFPFFYIGQKENNTMEGLLLTGHEQLASEITDLTSTRKPSMFIRLSAADSGNIASLIEEIQKLSDLPQEEQLRLSNISPKYVILPKYWILSGLAKVEAKISPFPEGDKNIAATWHFRPEEQLSGIRRLAKIIVCKMYQTENIHFADLERKAYRVGFRTFTQRGSNPEHKDYLNTIPAILHSDACSKTPPQNLEIRPFRPKEEDTHKSSSEYGQIYHLDYMVEGYIADVFGISCIGISIVNSNGATLKSFKPVEFNRGVMPRLEDIAGEIMVFLKSHIESRTIEEGTQP
jgi:hypothetical protein